jgi:hypothetical protein
MPFTIFQNKMMNKYLKIFPIWLIVFSCVFTSSTKAEQSQDFGEYTVHYIAVNSTFIAPEIAERYGIVRSARNAFLNISVIKNNGAAVPAQITGEKANFLSQNSMINFIEVIEGDAIYYIGQFDFSNAENLRFNVEVQPENSGPVYSLTWTTKLYIN